MRAIVQRFRDFVMHFGDGLSSDERARVAQQAAVKEHELQQFVNAAEYGDLPQAERIRRSIREEFELMRHGGRNGDGS
jgi:hypothetical protein